MGYLHEPLKNDVPALVHCTVPTDLWDTNDKAINSHQLSLYAVNCQCGC